MANTTYRITKTFISGVLEGLTITETFPFPMRVGFVVRKPCAGSSGYRVVSCEPVDDHDGCEHESVLTRDGAYCAHCGETLA